MVIDETELELLNEGFEKRSGQCSITQGAPSSVDTIKSRPHYLGYGRLRKV